MADQATTTAPATPVSSTGYISDPFALIGPSFEALKLNLGTFFAMVFAPIGALVAVAILYAIIGLSALTNGAVNIVLFVVGAIALLYVIFLLLPASTLLMLHSARGQKVTFRELIRQGYPFIWRLFLLSLLVGLTIIAGLILFIVPGLIFATWFALASYVMVDENLGVVASMKRSKQLVSGHVAEMMGMFGLGQAFSLLTIVPILGFIASIILSIIYAPSSAIRYDQLKAGAGETKTHWVNYAAIILALVSIGASTSVSINDAKNLDSNTNPSYNYFQ